MPCLDGHKAHPYGDALLQRLSFEQLHGDKRVAPVLVNIVDRADVGMVEGGGGLGFALEALERLMVLGHLLRQEFERHKAVELGVLSFVDDTHSSAAELLQDAVVGDGCAGHLSSAAYDSEYPDVRL